MSTLIDLTGRRFHRLVVLHQGTPNNKSKNARWICLCDCGRKTAVLSRWLRDGRIKSCGCLRAEKRTLEGHGKGGLYSTWRQMISRCEDQRNNRFSRYGGRGIRVCPEWRTSFLTFRSWALDHDYSPGLSIDRIDNDRNYEPSNCHFLTRSENSRKRTADARRGTK